MKFNLLQHKLVPEHRLLADDEAERVLKALRITKDQLPKIKKADPVIQVLERGEPLHPLRNRRRRKAAAIRWNRCRSTSAG